MKTTNPLPIVNAKKPVVLHITNTDLKQASRHRRDPTWCVIACAARRELGAANVRIHLSRMYILQGTRWLRYITPKSLRSEIIAFDRGGTFSPGEFWLAPPAPSKQTGRHQGGDHVEYMKPRNPKHITENVRPWATNRRELAA